MSPQPADSPLSRMRRLRYLQQAEVARLAGISRRKLQALERGDAATVDLRNLVNLAIVLECQLGDIIDPRWLQWRSNPRAPNPPAESRDHRIEPPAPSEASKLDPVNTRIAKSTQDFYGDQRRAKS
jgi:DNA-binding Xre family transcriptional regulator